MLQNHTQPTDKPVKLMERSLHSAKYCFAENLRRTGKMPESEYLVLTRWFDFMLQSEDLDLTVDLIVYLKVIKVSKLLEDRSQYQRSGLRSHGPLLTPILLF